MNNIEKEFVNFDNCFRKFKDKKIVLYGLGRCTRNILPLLGDYRVIGVLDQNDEFLGKKLNEIPVISVRDAESNADMIIINTSEMYWRIIYNRLSDVSVPVYLKNGLLANEYFQEYEGNSLLQLCKNDVQHFVANLICGYLKSINFDGTFYNWKDWGYSVWGPVAWSFLNWLVDTAKKNNINHLLFLSRDGYLLKKAYDVFKNYEKCENMLSAVYVVTSRRLTYYASITDQKSFEEYAYYFYNGTFADYLQIRFGIDASEYTDENFSIRLPEDKKLVEERLAKYIKIIKQDITEQQLLYKQYLLDMAGTGKIGVVDTGYTGKIGACLNKLLSRDDIRSYMFYGDLSESNEYRDGIAVCFQKEGDLSAKKCALRKQSFLVETVFTAPEGSAVCIKESGFEYTEQQSFEVNNKIYKGIEQFIADCAQNNIVYMQVSQVPLFVDELFAYMTSHTKLENKMQQSLHWEDLWSGTQATL